MAKKKIIVKNKKKAIKKKPTIKKAIKKKEKKVGKVTHYFSNIKVAVIRLSAPLKIGEVLKITGGENTDFNQKVKSMQIDHEKVKTAKKGKSIGLKIDEKVREGYNVYKI
jgi:putative protease